MTTPTLSIIIITLNEEAHLPRLLADLEAQTWTDFEILHVDSNSTDRTMQVSQAHQARYADYSIIAMTDRGVSLGRNVGAAQARGERLLFLDADTRLVTDFLETAMQDLDRKDLDVGVVCMSAEGLHVGYRLGYALFNFGIRVTAPLFPTAIGACLFSTAALHRAIGGFDETLSLCEDCNYVLKAQNSEVARIGVLSPRFQFDPRRLQQDGFWATGLTYLRANLHRFFVGELHRQEIPYRFGHYG